MAMTTIIQRLSIAACVFLLTIITSLAQEDRANEIEAASKAVAEIRELVDSDTLDDAKELETQLRDLRTNARTRLDVIERELEATRNQLDLLGPAPGETDPPESDFVSQERANLEERRARLNGQRTLVLANIYESGELLARISGAQVGALYLSLFERGPSPLAPHVWSDALKSAGEVTGRVQRYFGEWADKKGDSNSLELTVAAIALAIAISLIMFGPVSRWVSSTFYTQVEKRRPTPARRLFVAAMKMVARAIPGILGGLIIIETLRAFGVLTPQGEEAARAFWVGVLAALVVSGFTAGFFSPRLPDWRIAPVAPEKGKIISRIAMTIAIVFSLKILLVTIGNTAKANPELIELIRAAAAIVIGALLYMLSRKTLWRGEEPTGKKNSGWRLLRRMNRAVAVFVIVAVLAGYVAFADFITTRICYLAMILSVAWLSRALVVEGAFRIRARLAGEHEDKEDAEAASNNFRFWSRLFINTFLVIALLPVLLVLFGVSGEAVQDMAGQALFGFNIGGIHVPSIAKLFYAIIVFIIAMAVTRLVQTGLKRGPLAHSRADTGVQNSLTTLLGYAGLIVALFLSVSALGFDLSNLALIAGALSVGIGFGLQSIVNNFVSGLILLFERPIKVGDWIVTPSGEGIVKKISVRSTEIETWDRSSIIVPNSELISSAVTNWTHKNKIGRIIVPVGVSYSADPEKVKEILLSCARRHPKIVGYPEPFVTWMDFGASSLDFEIRAYLRDISDGLGVRTDLRFAIFKALAEEGIEIPFPQRDVHVKSLPEGFGNTGKETDDA